MRHLFFIDDLAGNEVTSLVGDPHIDDSRIMGEALHHQYIPHIVFHVDAKIEPLYGMTIRSVLQSKAMTSPLRLQLKAQFKPQKVRGQRLMVLFPQTRFVLEIDTTYVVSTGDSRNMSSEAEPFSNVTEGYTLDDWKRLYETVTL